MLRLSKSTFFKRIPPPPKSYSPLTTNPLIYNSHHDCPIKAPIPTFSSFKSTAHPSPPFTFPSLIGRSFMATCSSLRSLFEKPLPENPTLLESLSAWNQIKPLKPIETSSIAEIFGELYFPEKPEPKSADSPLPSPPPTEPPALDQTPQSVTSEPDSKNGHMRENLSLDALLGLSTNRCRGDEKNDSLQLLTEGLGSESSDDVDDLMENGCEWRSWGMGKRRSVTFYGGYGYTRSACGWDVRPPKIAKEFPPPISSIGRSGKPRVCLRSYREDGRFVLREMRIPSQELLRASREDGRLKLNFVRPDEDIAEGDEEEEECREENEQEVEGGIEEKKEEFVESKETICIGF